MHDHPAGATGTSISRRRTFGYQVVGLGARMFGGGRRRGQHRRARLTFSARTALANRPSMANVEAGRKHMHEKAADELGGVERHGLEPIAPRCTSCTPCRAGARRDPPGRRARQEFRLCWRAPQTMASWLASRLSPEIQSLCYPGNKSSPLVILIPDGLIALSSLRSHPSKDRDGYCRHSRK